MANIRRETRRHDWIHPLTLNNGECKVPGSSKCRNCGIEIYGREPSQTSGCAFEVKVANFSEDRMRALRNHEMNERQREQAQEYELLRRTGQMDRHGNII